ncbi:hypothetical protein ALC62_03677, partial [Cyphomyrmex costatus]
DVLSTMRHVGRGWARSRRATLVLPVPVQVLTMPVRFDPAAIRSDFTRKSRISRLDLIRQSMYRPPRKSVQTVVETERLRFTRDGRRACTERLNRYTQPLTVIIAAITGLSLSFFLSTPVFLSLLAVHRLFFPPPCQPPRLRPPLTIIATVTRPSSSVYISHGDISSSGNLSCGGKRECGTRHDGRSMRVTGRCSYCSRTNKDLCHIDNTGPHFARLSL